MKGRHRLFLALIPLVAITLSPGCSSSRPEVEESVITDAWTLSAPLQVNPSGAGVLPGSYLRTSRMYVSPEGTPYVMWTRQRDNRMMIQSVDLRQLRVSDPVDLFNQEDSLLEHPRLGFDAAQNLMFAAAWEKNVAAGVTRGDKHVLFVRSTDRGKSWSSPVSLNTGTGSFGPEMVYDGQGSIYVVWKDERTGFSDLYFNRSKDYGLTWLSKDIRLSPGKAGEGVSTSPSLLCIPGGRVMVAFGHTPSTGISSIQYRSSSDYGSSWSAPVRVNDNPKFHMDFPQLVRGPGGKLAISWIFVGDHGFAALYFDRSLNDGKSWGDDRIIFSAAPSRVAHLSMTGWRNDSLSLLWVDLFENELSLLHKFSADFGTTWKARTQPEGRVNHDLSRRRTIDVQIASDGNRTLAAIWAESRLGTSLIKSNFSFDRGETWLPDSIVISPKKTGEMNYLHPQLALHGDSLFTLYQRRIRDDLYVDLFVRSVKMTGWPGTPDTPDRPVSQNP